MSGSNLKYQTFILCSHSSSKVYPISSNINSLPRLPNLEYHYILDKIVRLWYTKKGGSLEVVYSISVYIYNMEPQSIETPFPQKVKPSLKQSPPIVYPYLNFLNRFLKNLENLHRIHFLRSKKENRKRTKEDTYIDINLLESLLSQEFTSLVVFID